MKKLLFIPLVFSLVLLQAQEPIKKFAGGIKLGMGLSYTSIKGGDTLEPGFNSAPLFVLIAGFRLTVNMTNHWLLITDLSFAKKGAVSSLYRKSSTAFSPSLQFNAVYKPRSGENSIIFGGGPFIDFNRSLYGYKSISGGINLLAGFQFFPGFSVELSCKNDLIGFRQPNEQNLGFSDLKNTTIGLCMAYKF